jgi:predicted NUDIX family NTP pyrophosphohydrolase
MAKVSAGILLYRRRSNRSGRLEFFLVHPGGPYFTRKDEGAWTIPKGEVEQTDPDKLCAAIREFCEETGFPLKYDPAAFRLLQPTRMNSGKWIHAWAQEGDADPDQLSSNLFEMEWPPKSGKRVSFPEVDRAGWFDLQTAQEKIHPAQRAFLLELEAALTAQGE